VECLIYYCAGDIASIIVGDLNCELINWVQSSAPLNTIQNTFLKCFNDLGLIQHINEPTRRKNILDIILSNYSLLVSNAAVIGHFSNSCDNLSLSFNVNLIVVPKSTVIATVPTCVTIAKIGYLQIGIPFSD